MKTRRLIDLCCGRWGWSRVFAARGWECHGYDLTLPPDVPDGCVFHQTNILDLTADDLRGFDFGVASTPCEQFSIFGQPHFHPDPPAPEIGLSLFNHARRIFEESGIPFLMENVRTAQDFVGVAAHHCGPFYLWGNSVPPLMPGGIQKGTSAVQGWLRRAERKLPPDEKKRLRLSRYSPNGGISYTMSKKKRAALTAMIPTLLASTVADYAERIIPS